MSEVFFSSATRVARKEHPCYWCREPILSGATFYEWRAAEDGRAYTGRMHGACDLAHRRAADYTQPMWGEPNCFNTDVDGGGHNYGQNCPDCSEVPVS